MKNTLEGINNGLEEEKDQISNIKDKKTESTQTEHQKERNFF